MQNIFKVYFSCNSILKEIIPVKNFRYRFMLTQNLHKKLKHALVV